MAKIGVSSYSLTRLRKTGEFSIPFAVDWIADNGGEHIETLDMPELDKSPAGLEALRCHAARRGIEISGYIFGADFLHDDPAQTRAEIEAVKKQIDIAHALGAPFVRHDCARRRPPNTSTEQFEKDLPVLIAACRELADYAAQYGIVTSIENHGMHLQASERVRRLVLGVARPNFKTTIDVGNFVCVDEEPYFAVRDNLPFASFIHVKDFHRKPPAADPGEGWNRSSGGAWWRGAIAGHGDIDLPTIVRAIKASGYDGYLSLEFEGLEDPRLGCRIGLDNVKRYWREA